MADTSQHGAYRVLARKYRPRGFEDLIGQDAMVRTFRNAFESNRIHQAYIFTGVRGVGKTTTARIIARALNYEKDDGTVTMPTIAMPDFGKHCESIIDSRHIDVIEMDAASNTGVDHVREIIEAVKYRPAYARYKVYIIDEVHMLSTSSFNALLKTLEEPPEHVKFLFATTEIRKVPITVLSRCQRFDLKRIDAPLMIRHLRGIAEQEKIIIEDEALALIVRAGEGSVRDCLSLLDQAIAHGGGTVISHQIRDMLGLADRARIIDLFEHVMRGDIRAALEELAAQYDSGADPVSIITDLAEYVHTVTRLKLAPGVQADPSLSETEKSRGQAFAQDLTIRVLTRAWQILTKGLQETQTAPRPIIAAEMLLVRLAYAADLPTPDEALKMLRDGNGAQGGGASSGQGPRGGGGGTTAAAVSRPVMVATNPVPEQRAAQPQSAPQMRSRNRHRRCASAPSSSLLRWRRRSVTRCWCLIWSGMCAWCDLKTASSSLPWRQGLIQASSSASVAACRNGPGAAGRWLCPTSPGSQPFARLPMHAAPRKNHSGTATPLCKPF